MKFLVYFALLLNLVLLNKVISFKVNIHEALLSEDDMNDMINDEEGVKQVIENKKISPTSKVNFIGQVGGLDTDADGNLIVFHRASRRWAWDTFQGDTFNKEKYPAIQENVVEMINPKNLKHIATWGSDIFYMPHGLTVDYEGNLWLTDVGTHQAYKFRPDISDEPLLTLGEKFKQGSDNTHLCKPTSVAVAQINGHVFVADGYCNNRVVEYDKKGNFVRQFQDKNRPLIIVHSITLVEQLGLVCTVSREEGRIVCFDIHSGDKKYEITDPSMQTVYAIEYDNINQLLHAVTGENHGSKPVGLTFDGKEKNFGKLLFKWQPKNTVLSDAHDIAILPNGSKIYTGQLNGEIDEFVYE